MCGIFGWSVVDNLERPVKKKLQIVADILAYGNDSRGGDSWGAYVKYSPGKSKLLKGLGRFAVTGARSLNMCVYGKILLGHTRKATHGDVTTENAHPFICGNVVGAHNGIISNHDELNRTYGRTFVVDSKHIFEHLDQGLSTQSIKGYGAIEYVRKDDKEGSVFLGKFHGGQLAIASVKDVGIFWSSDDWDLNEALSLAGLDGTNYKVEVDKLYRAKDCELYEVQKLDFTSPWAKTSCRSYSNLYGHMTETAKDPWEFHSQTKSSLKEDIIKRLEKTDWDTLTDEEWNTKKELQKQSATPGKVYRADLLKCNGCCKLVSTQDLCITCGLCDNFTIRNSCCKCESYNIGHVTYRMCAECQKAKKSDLVCGKCWRCILGCCICKSEMQQSVERAELEIKSINDREDLWSL